MEQKLRVLHKLAVDASIKEGPSSTAAVLAEGDFQRAVDMTYVRMQTIDNTLKKVQEKLGSLTPETLRKTGVI